MKKITLILTAFLFVGMAFAADLPNKTVSKSMPMASPVGMNWAGFYTGLNIGADFGKTKDTINALTSNFSGLIYGVQAGYDWQFDQFVGGFAADYTLGNARGGTSISSNQILNEASMRARFGYLMSQSALLYLTGGYALISNKNTSYTLGYAEQKTHNGYVVGLGGEVKLGSSWSMFGEYRYSAYKTATYFNGLSNGSGTISNIRAGVNYRF